QDQCFPRRSVDLFKSCDLGAENPDDLCANNGICERVNEQGLRCLPTCTVSTYATPEAGITIRDQCSIGTTCWVSDRGQGVCSEGLCSDMPNNCAANNRCAPVNGAGVCFLECRIFDFPSACAGGYLCHPVLDTDINACIPPGPRQLGEQCDDVTMCAQTD